jgi:hypothetical protein
MTKAGLGFLGPYPKRAGATLPSYPAGNRRDNAEMPLDKLAPGFGQGTNIFLVTLMPKKFILKWSVLSLGPNRLPG